MTKKEKKFHSGCPMGLILKKEDRDVLMSVARECQMAENWLWDELRKNDPADSNFLFNNKKNEKGKFEPLPKYYPGNYEEFLGKTAYYFVQDLTRICNSNIAATISYEVCNLYNKNRLDFLRHQKSLMTARNPMIRFKNTSIRIFKTEKGYAVKIYLLRNIDRKRQKPIVAGLNTKKIQGPWREFLEKSCENTKKGPCGGKIIFKNGRWRITLLREKTEEELNREAVLDDNKVGCVLPGEGDEFLKIVLLKKTKNGYKREWSDSIGCDAYLKSVKADYYNLRRKMGENFKHSASSSAARGHGLKRKNESLVPMSKKDKIDRDFIETRTHFIINMIIRKWKCGTVRIEDLVDRKDDFCPVIKSNRINFPYYKFIERLVAKVKEQGAIPLVCKPRGGLPENVMEDVVEDTGPVVNVLCDNIISNKSIVDKIKKVKKKIVLKNAKTK